MGSHGFPWVPMGSHGSPWVPMGSHGSPWVPMGPHGDPWAPMRNHGFPWDPMGPHGFPWVPMGTQGDPSGPMGTHGNPWVPMGPHGDPWIFHGFSMNYRGGRRPTKNVGGCGGGGSPPHEFSRPGSRGRALWKHITRVGHVRPNPAKVRENLFEAQKSGPVPAHGHAPDQAWLPPHRPQRPLALGLAWPCRHLIIILG